MGRFGMVTAFGASCTEILFDSAMVSPKHGPRTRSLGWPFLGIQRVSWSSQLCSQKKLFSFTSVSKGKRGEKESKFFSGYLCPPSPQSQPGKGTEFLEHMSSYKGTRGQHKGTFCLLKWWMTCVYTFSSYSTLNVEGKGEVCWFTQDLKVCWL